MTALNDINEISIALRNCKTEKIRILHKFIFENDGDRSNRKRIRSFSGFDFSVNDKEYAKKLKYIDDTFSLNKLITICNILHVPFDGSKPNISKRILSFLCDLESLAASVQEIINSSESELDDTVPQKEQKTKSDLAAQCSEVENKSSSSQCEMNINETRSSRTETTCNVNINYSDIENTISRFNGETYENVNNWIKHFENVSQMFSLSDLQKFIFAIRALGVIAQLFVKTEIEINSWQKLKHALIEEFSFEINSANLHELLSKRKMKGSETAQEYFLKMKELSSSGKIEDSALMHYIIKGLMM